MRAFGARLASARAVQSREHACAFAAGLPLVPMSVVGVWLESPLAQARARACSAHDLMLVTVSIDYVSRWQASGNNFVVEGSSCRLLGCVVWFTVQLAATCFVMRRLVRRENASRDLDLSAACTARDGRGRCLRRSLTPRARRGQLQRVSDGCGMSYGRSGGGRVLAGGIYSHFGVVPFSFAF